MIFNLPFLPLLLTLRFTRPARFHFLHGGAVNGLLCNALGAHPLPEGVIPFAPESGRVRAEPGDLYHIGVTLVGEASALSDSLLAGLERIGKTEPDRNRPLPTFAGNFEVAEARALPAPDLDAEAIALAKAGGPLTIRFLSPLRMERPNALQVKGATFLNADCFPAAHFLARVWGRLFRLAHGREATKDEQRAFRPPLPDGASAVDPRLLWLDLPIPGMRGAHNGHSNGLTLGGVVGRVTLEGVPEDWLPILLQGSFLHAGEKASFGLGRYRIETGSLSPFEFPPAATLLSRTARPETLRAALERVVASTEASGIDGLTPEDALADADRLIDRLSAELHEGRYAPEALLGVLLPKEGGKVRPLAIPTLLDRTAQRAACDLLAPAIDTLLEDSSYAYRKGLSRSAAAFAVRRAYDDGFRWVLDADIASFFDAVDWDRLFAKLEALYPYEPLVELMKRWVAAPVVFRGRRIERARGLPQGAVISPLLANLFLDELDEELLGENFRLVRYADDFLILCRDLDEARAAREKARSALADLGLRLNVEKTEIRSFEDGFSYLGYLFCRSLVIESKRPEEPSHPADGDVRVPEASWLASVPIETVREALRRSSAGKPAADPAAREVRARSLSDAGPILRPLYFADPAAEIFLREEKLVVGTLAEGLREFGARTLSHVVFIGRVRVTVPVLLTLSRLGVPSYFCRRSGELYASFSTHAPDWPLWEAQGRKASDSSACLAIARLIVAAKLHNAAALAARHTLQGWGELGESLRELEKKCLEQTSLEMLRGLEGRGAALFFSALRESLPAAWGFRKREKHPPPDPVNAMLSLAYTMLYNHLSTAILAAGLHPRIGFYHAERGAYHALASDLQEEMRHLADGFVIASIRRNEIKPEDFTRTSSGPYPCLFTIDARKDFIRRFEGRLLTEFTPPGASEKETYLAFMNRQVRALKAFVRGEATAYEPLRIHA
ncbi:MAG: CRISPR-associated endonuclease Cas1 [Candidatus Eisenbacteria bacterium]|nr:CRISPR-associated endonuclease Cas1 [Candidatus Eisenbacteria bacterium]